MLVVDVKRRRWRRRSRSRSRRKHVPRIYCKYCVQMDTWYMKYDFVFILVLLIQKAESTQHTVMSDESDDESDEREGDV